MIQILDFSEMLSLFNEKSYKSFPSFVFSYYILFDSLLGFLADPRQSILQEVFRSVCLKDFSFPF